MVIRLSAGLVSKVLYSADDDPELSVIVQDADVEGLEDDEVTEINGREFLLSEIEPIKDLGTVNAVFKKVWG